MTVWILNHDSFDHTHVEGVYASEEMARKVMIARALADIVEFNRDIEEYYEGDPVPESEIFRVPEYDPATVVKLEVSALEFYYIVPHVVVTDG